MRAMFAALGAAAAAALLLIGGPVFADGHGKPSPDVAEPPLHAAPIPTTTAPSQGQTGQITLDNGAVVLNVRAGWRFYPAPDARAYLQRANATPPTGDVLGVLAPAGKPLDGADTWACVVSYDPIGYVQASTASGLTSGTLESDVRSARASQNRPFEGFAVPPAFVAATPILTWGERTAPPASGGRDLRYEQKLPGRRGVVDLTSIGTADQMTEITAAGPTLAGIVSFPQGQRYADFVSASDQVSNYDVPGLITGVAVTQLAQAPGAQTQNAGGGLNPIYLWVAGGVAALGAGGFLLMRRRRDPNITPEA